MKMMTKLSAILLVAAASAAWPAMAQTTPTPPATNAPARTARAPRYTGTVATVDTTNMVLTMKATTRTPAFKVKITSTTKITKDRQPAEFKDVMAGVRISGGGKKDDDGNWTATTLAIAIPRPATNAPPAAAKQN